MSAFEKAWKIIKYEMECFSCGLTGGYDTFGMGRNRKCPDCGSYEVHSSDVGEHNPEANITSNAEDEEEFQMRFG